MCVAVSHPLDSAIVCRPFICAPQIDADRAAAQQLSTEEHERAQKRDEELREAERNLGALATERQGMDAEKQAAEAARSEALAVLTRAELDAQELQEKLKRDQVLKVREHHPACFTALMSCLASLLLDGSPCSSH